MMRYRLQWAVMALVALGMVYGTSCQSGPAPASTASSTQSASEEAQTRNGPQRIILFIGDGMGVGAVTAAAYSSGQPLAMMTMPSLGWMTTHEHEYLTTDSAASATAIATGQKTHFQGVAVTPGTTVDEEGHGEHQMRSLVEAAQEQQWKTGLISTTRINHATPAPFAAHRSQRHQYEDLAQDMAGQGVDVLLGGGRQYFERRDDGRDLLAEMADQGYAVASDAAALRQAAGQARRLVGLLHDKELPWVHEQRREMGLAEMVAQAIEVLDRDNERGFLLMVEGSLIDWAGHALDGENVVAETLDMDRAVAEALEYGRRREDTLVVVTADHETGALDILDKPTAAPFIEALGGDRQARARTIPDAVEPEKEGRLTGPYAALPLGGGEWGFDDFAPGAAIVASFGYFSPASRAFWDGEGRFSAIHTPEVVPVFAEGPTASQLVRAGDSADLGRQLMRTIEGPGESPSAAARGGASGDDQGAPQERPHNVILMVGDGLGAAAVTATHYLSGPAAVLGMEQSALVATHGEERLVNTERAAATALATGRRSRAQRLGYVDGEDGELVALESVWHVAKQSGLALGLVSNNDLSRGVSPAFYARDQGELSGDAIREQLHGWDVDFVGTPGGADGQSLAGVTASALEQLGDEEEGFFLVVDATAMAQEMAQLEQGAPLVERLGAFNMAVALMRSYAAAQEDTLVLVTSLRDQTLGLFDDHYGFHRQNCGVAQACGGDHEIAWHAVDPAAVAHAEGFVDPALRGDAGPPRMGFQYTWLAQSAAPQMPGFEAPASANLVPLFAQGPQAAAFSGFMDQPEIGRWLKVWAAESVP